MSRSNPDQGDNGDSGIVGQSDTRQAVNLKNTEEGMPGSIPEASRELPKRQLPIQTQTDPKTMEKHYMLTAPQETLKWIPFNPEPHQQIYNVLQFMAQMRKKSNMLKYLCLLIYFSLKFFF